MFNMQYVEYLFVLNYHHLQISIDKMRRGTLVSRPSRLSDLSGQRSISPVNQIKPNKVHLMPQILAIYNSSTETLNLSRCGQNYSLE